MSKTKVKTEKTVQCRLLASDSTRQQLWTWMLDTSELINTLLNHIHTHPDFDSWLEKGGLPPSIVDSLVKSAKIKPPYSEMPSRFITSAQNLVKHMYKSWFEIQRRKRLSLMGKRRFYAILKSDEELQLESADNFQNLRTEAQKILQTTFQQLEQKRQKDNQPPPTTEKQAFWELTNTLYDAYETAKNSLRRCAIALLIKNYNTVPEKPEDPQKFAQRRQEKAVQIQRLEAQLKAKTPKGRQINPDNWLRILEKAQEAITEEEEFREIQAELLRKFDPIVYPVTFASNTDLTWFTNQQGRICVRLHGMSNYPLEIACNQRQPHWFERFLADSELYRQQKREIPTGLMPLRCANLVWTEGQDNSTPIVAKWLFILLIKQKLEKIAYLMLTNPHLLQSPPWKTHHLYLYCSLDTRLGTDQGKAIVKAEKIAKTEQILTNFEKKSQEQENGLTPNQQSKLKSYQTSLRLLKNNDCFTTSKSTTYQGNPNIILGVSIGLEQPVTIAIMDISRGKLLTYRNPKQLLSKKRRVRAKQPPLLNGEKREHFRNIYQQRTDYQLFTSLRQQKHRHQHQRHKAQRHDIADHSHDANLSLYINRLFAKSIIEIAQNYQVSTIILPDLKNKREIIEAEILAKAQLKIPKDKKAQQNYAKDFRTKVHQWSYQQLSDCIQSKASQLGIPVEIIRQITRGNPYHKARNLISTFVEQNPIDISIEGGSSYNKDK